MAKRESASGRERRLSLEDAQRLVGCYVERYNDIRLNSAIGYITPKDMLGGRQQEIYSERDGSWRRHENSGRFVGSKPLDVQLTPVGHSSAGDGVI